MGCIYLRWITSNAKSLRYEAGCSDDEECGDRMLGGSVSGAVLEDRLKLKFIKSDAKLWPPVCSAVVS